MLTPIQGVDPRIAKKASSSQLTTGAVTSDSNGLLVGNSVLAPQSIYSNQSFQNILQNGSFELWDAGTNTYPNKWIIHDSSGSPTVGRDSTYYKYGSYSMKLSIADGERYYIRYEVPNYANYIGKTMSLLVSSKSSHNNWVIVIDDGIGYTATNLGSSNVFETKTVSRTIDNSATHLWVIIGISATSGAQTLYVDGAILVEGSVCPAFTEHPFDKVLNETRFKVGSFTRDISLASGTQAITGIGFSPAGVIFITGVSGVAGQMSWGFSTGSVNISFADYQNITAAAYAIAANHCIEIFVSGSNYVQGAVSSLGSDGFTLSWTKTGSPTGTATIVYFAFR